MGTINLNKNRTVISEYWIEQYVDHIIKDKLHTKKRTSIITLPSIMSNDRFYFISSYIEQKLDLQKQLKKQLKKTQL